MDIKYRCCTCSEYNQRSGRTVQGVYQSWLDVAVQNNSCMKRQKEKEKEKKIYENTKQGGSFANIYYSQAAKSTKRLDPCEIASNQGVKSSGLRQKAHGDVGRAREGLGKIETKAVPLGTERNLVLALISFRV